MDPETFRAHAHELVDWMADYLAGVEARPVVPTVAPGEVAAQLGRRAPEHGEGFEAIFEDFERIIMPGMTHWNHPGWFAYFPANHSPPSILAELLTATLGAQCMSWQTSPAATELEQVVMRWLAEACGLVGMTGVIQDTASTSTLVALLTARERATLHRWGVEGAAAEGADRLVVYASAQAHSSIDKGVKLAGYGLDRLRHVPTMPDDSMDVAALDVMIAEDLARGLIPACVVATIGTTSCCGVDPIAEIGPLCARHGIWLHVDAAYAGSAALLPEHRHWFAGLEFADSYVFNPHKWLLVNFDCSAYFVRDVDALRHTFQTSPEYLRTTHDDEVVNLRDWGVQLGRRFRALKLWFVLRSYGLEGLRAMLRDHIQWAQELGDQLQAHPTFELLSPVRFGLVCLRWNDPTLNLSPDDLNAANAALLARVNATGEVYMTHTVQRGVYMIRLSVGQWQTQRAHVQRAFELLCRESKGLV